MQHCFNFGLQIFADFFVTSDRQGVAVSIPRRDPHPTTIPIFLDLQVTDELITRHGMPSSALLKLVLGYHTLPVISYCLSISTKLVNLFTIASNHLIISLSLI